MNDKFEKELIGTNDNRDLIIARLKWENRYLLNQMKVNSLVTGDYGKLEPFSDEIVSEKSKVNREKLARFNYTRLGGDISDWWIYEFKKFISPYGLFSEKVSSGIWNFFYANDEGKHIIATIDSSTLKNNCFYLKNNDVKEPLIFDYTEDNWLIIRNYLFKWQKESQM